MKKQLFIATGVLLILFGCNHNNVKNDLKEANLLGNVKSVRQTSFKALEKFGKLTKGDRYGYGDGDGYVLYNDEGNIIEQNEYNSDGSLSFKHTYTYDNKGNMIEQNRYNSDGSLSKKYTSTYDNKGNVIEENEYDSDGHLASRWTYIYDNKGAM